MTQPDIFRKVAAVLVPGISNTLSAMASSQARATWAGAAPWLAAMRVTIGWVRIASCCFFGQPNGQNGTNAIPRAVHSLSTACEARSARLYAFCTQTMGSFTPVAGVVGSRC